MPALAGRKIFIVGAGGAGMSAYALLAKAWGADVAGWDRNDTPYAERLRADGIRVAISAEPEPPAGWEVFVSSAYSFPGRSRAELLAELVSLRRSIVVSGTHGKTTTAGMIAFCLEQLGHDPAFVIGAEIPQLGGNAAAGEGWLVAEGDESDRTVERLRPEIAVVTNVELDHHTTFSSGAEVEDMFERWLSHIPHAVRGWELEGPEIELALPGRHNRLNAASALAALELAGIDRADAAEALSGFSGAARRCELVGMPRGIAVYDDYAHHPSEVEAAIDAAREMSSGRVLVAFQPHLYSRTRHLAREFGAALSAADVVCITDVYAAREERVDDVSGKLIVDALAEVRPGATIGWTPGVEDVVSFLAARLEKGDVAVTIGAGDIDEAGRRLVEALA